MSPATDVRTLMRLIHVRLTCPMKYRETLIRSPKLCTTISCIEIVKPALPHNVSDVEHVWYSGLYCVNPRKLHGGNYVVSHKIKESNEVVVPLFAGDAVGQTFGSVVGVVLINFYTAERNLGSTNELV